MTQNDNPIIIKTCDEVVNELHEFSQERLRQLLLAKGYRHDVIDAVLNHRINIDALGTSKQFVC